MKCENCKKEESIVFIQNYIVTYKSWEAYNCCCEACAMQCAKSGGITEDEIESIE